MLEVLFDCDHTWHPASSNEVVSFMQIYSGVSSVSRLQGLYPASVNMRYKAFGSYFISSLRLDEPLVLKFNLNPEAYHLQIVLSGRFIKQQTGNDQELSTGDCFIVNPTDRLVINCTEPGHLLSIRIPKSNISDTLYEFGYVLPTHGVKFTDKVLSLSRRSGVQRLLSDILALDHVTILPANLIKCHTQLLDFEVVKWFQHNIDIFGVNHHEAGGVINKIRRLVLSDVTKDYSLDALAGYCRVSKKTLYNTFSKELEITPSEFIKHLKLQSVYYAIKDDGKLRNVTEVAISFGFTNLSRFSRDYFNLIGERPSDTLKKRAV